MCDQGDRRIIVEICAHAEVEKLRQEMKQQDDLHRAEVESLQRRLDGLHRTLYEVIDTLSHLRSKR